MVEFIIMKFTGKENTFVADWLEKQGLAKLKALFEGINTS